MFFAISTAFAPKAGKEIVIRWHSQNNEGWNNRIKTNDVSFRIHKFCSWLWQPWSQTQRQENSKNKAVLEPVCHPARAVNPCGWGEASACRLCRAPPPPQPNLLLHTQHQVPPTQSPTASPLPHPNPDKPRCPGWTARCSVEGPVVPHPTHSCWVRGRRTTKEMMSTHRHAVSPRGLDFARTTAI